MNYVLALMFHDGHAEGQIIDPATGRLWCEINFHGTVPYERGHFEAQGAMLIPISRTSATALRDLMDQLKLLYGTGARHAEEMGGVSRALERLAVKFPEQSASLHCVVAAIDAQLERAQKDNTYTLFDDALVLPDRLRALAEEVRAQAPELAAALVEGDESVLGQYHFCATPYYFVDGADQQGSRMKYERQHEHAQDFAGKEIELAFQHPRTFKRPTEAMPLIGTNCLNFVLRSGRDVAGIPFTKIAPQLYDTHNVATLERIIEEKVMQPGHEIQDGMDVRVEALEGGTPIAYLNAPGACVRFPECLKELSHGGKGLLEQLATTRHPLLDRSISHAAMRA